jgi:hypothetical protein
MFKTLKIQHVALFSILLFYLLIARQPVIDTDSWWHLRVGQYILQNDTIPRTDPFSFSNAGHVWITHEWLSQVLYYLAYKAWNIYGLIVFNMAVISTIFVLLYKITLLRSGRSYMSAVLCLAAALMTIVFWVFRPHMIGYVCFLLYLYILEKYKKYDSRIIWILPVVMLVWVNAHGSYIMGLLLILLYLVAGLIHGKIGRMMPEPWKKHQIKDLVVSLAVSFAVTFLNPNSYKMVIYPFYTVGSANIVDTINEWSSPNFHDPFFLFYLGAILAVISLMILYDGKHRISDLLTVGLFTFLALFAVRNLALFAFACVPVTGYYLSKLIRLKPEGKQNYFLNWFFAGAVTVAMVALWPPVNNLTIHQNKNIFPAAAVSFMAENRLNGNILNDYNWGGYLLWFRYPQNRMFIDGRTDIYVDKVMPDYLKIVKLSPDSMKILKNYNPDYILIKPDAALNQVLLVNKEWKVLYRDKVAVLYGKQSLSS